MLFAQVTEKEQEELKEAIKEAKKAKWYRRLKIVDLSSQGYRVPKLSEMFDIGEGRVREYIKQYNKDGIDGLRPGKSPGRQVSIPLSKEEWEELLTRRPSQFEALKTKARNWSQPLLQRYLYHYHQLDVSQGTISSTLKRLGISWKRAKKK
jgi:transposase